MWGRLRKGTMVSASISHWEKAVPPAFALILDSSVPPHMSLVLYELLIVSVLELRASESG